ncbi:hypothetical protein BgiMline_024648 [Biomphalaria glabrata]
MKTGVLFSSKDGGAHVSTHERNENKSDFTIQKDSINFVNSDTHTTIGSVLQLDDEFVEKFNVSDPSSGTEIHLDLDLRLQHHHHDHPDHVIHDPELDVNIGHSMTMGLEVGDIEETENVNNQTLDWLKQGVSSSDVDMLEICNKDSTIEGLSMGLDSHSIGGPDLSSENLDYMFSKQSESAESSYFEALDNGEYPSSMTNFVNTVNINWSGHQVQSPKLNNDTICQLSSTNDAVGEFVSFSDQDVLSDSLNNTSASDLNSILYSSLNKPDSSAVKIVQFTPNSSFIEAEQGINNISNSVLKTVPLSFSTTLAENISVSNIKDVATDLNLTSLPNFLGLENIGSSSISSSLIDSQEVVNILQGLAPGINSSDIKIENNLPEEQGLNVTTISILNDDEHSTKILVDSHRGQQQKYVIKTADLTQENCSQFHLNSSHGQQMYLINPTSGDQSSESQRTAVATAMPGFVLMPVLEGSSNLIQIVPVSLPEDVTKKPAKKLLMCLEPGCKKTFKKTSKLKVHQMLHTGERPFKCTLLGCEWAFTTSNKLKRHMESHEGRKDFVCDSPGCGHRFTTIYNLNTHKRIHERPCTESCPEAGCTQSFPTKRQLELHLRNVHALEDRTLKCPEPGCEKLFYSSGCMGTHMRIHQQKAEDLQCKYPGCGKQFKKLCRLKQHQKLHSGEKPFVCEYPDCNWAFTSASKLKRHQTKHTGLRRWACPMCRKQFQRSEHLRGHLITHTGDRPFVCPVEGCGNTFTAKSTLYVHLKKHDESGKTIVYHCPMEKCERHYTNKVSLRQHILVKHCNVPQDHLPCVTDNQGTANNWLSLLGTGDQQAEIQFSQETYTEAVTQPALTPSQDALLATDFLTGDQALGQSSNNLLPVQTNTGHVTQKLVSGNSSTLNAIGQPSQHYTNDEIAKKLLDTSDLFQRERLSIEVVERGRKSQIMLENVHGSARTDLSSNEIISQRSLKRWQKQKEIEAAKLKNRLEADNRPKTPVNIVANTSVDYKNPVSNNVSLGGQQMVHTVLVPRSDCDSMETKEIPDMELQAEGIPDLVLDGGAISSDSFMTDLFIRDPETGITYRQTQLLQDDPPMMEEADVHSLVLDPSLDVHFVEDSLNFNSLE